MSPAGGDRGLLLAGALLTLLALARPAEPPACRAPREAASVGGFSAAVACGGGAAEGLRGPARLLFGARLDANRASPRALESLPGIGPSRAQALVRAREEGPLCRPADLERARGIGPVLRARIEPFLATGGAGCGSASRP